MLVPFAIDAESLTPDDAWTAAQQMAYHMGVLDTWQGIGILVHDGPEFQVSRTKEAIDALPQKLRPLWQELLGRLSVLPEPQWEGIAHNNNSCLDILSASVDLVLLDDAKAELEFGIDEAELFRVLDSHPSLEICRLLAVTQAKTFKRALTIAGQHIPAGQTFSELWCTRFKLLAKAPIKQVSIVDRYAVSQHYECPQGKLSGLERFLRLLDADASEKRYVTVYSAWTPALKDVTLEDVQTEVKTIMDHLQRHVTTRVKIVMLPNSVFGNLNHDRFIRFGEYVWDVGVGLKVFEGAFVAETSTASLKTGMQAATYKQAEETLSVHAQARTIEATV